MQVTKCTPRVAGNQRLIVPDLDQIVCDFLRVWCAGACWSWPCTHEDGVCSNSASMHVFVVCWASRQRSGLAMRSRVDIGKGRGGRMM